MDETCRLRRGEGYGVCADAVVSKCALTGEKRGRPPVSRRPSSGFNRAAAASVSGNPPVQTVPSSVPLAAPFPESHPPE